MKPPPIAHTPIKDSSAITSMGHQPQSQTLEVTYRHDGATYRYSGVSTAEHQSLLAAESKGKALHALLARRKLIGVRLKEAP
jgi:hypothetical protein